MNNLYCSVVYKEPIVLCDLCDYVILYYLGPLKDKFTIFERYCEILPASPQSLYKETFDFTAIQDLKAPSQ